MCAVVVRTTPVMHEHVHQGAGGQQQPRQRTEDVRRVLGEEKERSDREKASARDPGLATPKSTSRVFGHGLPHRASECVATQ